MTKSKLNPFTGEMQLIGEFQQANVLLALSTDQGSINANTTINLQDNISGVTVNNNIIFNNGTNRATLKSGSTYKLQAYCRHWGNPNNTASNFQWYDITNSVFIGKSSQIASINGLTNDGEQPTNSTILTPSTDIEVELRCLSVSAPNQGLRADATHAIIEKISENVINTVTAGATDIKLQRVDNDLFETAQFNVEYYSSTQHGRIYGIVYRKYFDIANAVGVGQTIDIPLGVTITQFVGFGGFVEQLGGSLLPIPFNWVDYTSDNVGVMILSNKQTLRIASGTTLDHEGGKCWVDYTK